MLIGFVARRLLMAIPIVFVVIVINFTIIHLAPGDPVRILVSDVGAPPEYIEMVRREMGLDKPIYEQLLIYVGRMLLGDFGYSYTWNQPVFSVLLGRVGATFLLMFTAFLISLALGIVLGVTSSKRPYSLTDNLITTSSLVVYSMPNFWVGMIFLIVFCLHLGLFPTHGMVTVGATGINSVLQILWHLFLPAMALGLSETASLCRFTRSGILEVLRQDYILTARAKGCDERTVFYRHALRNSLLSIVTILGLRVRMWFTGSVLIETVFAWPGIGRLLYDSIFARDFNMLMAIFIVVAILTILGNLFADVAYALVDPRIRYK